MSVGVITLVKFLYPINTERFRGSVILGSQSPLALFLNHLCYNDETWQDSRPFIDKHFHIIKLADVSSFLVMSLCLPSCFKATKLSTIQFD